MYREGTDENAVEISDVLCDFCRRPWTEDITMVEGHRGACICGDCLTQAWTALHGDTTTCPRDHWCVLCREGAEDRASMNRADEPGWVQGKAGVCRRCVRQAGVALERDEDTDWVRPATGG